MTLNEERVKQLQSGEVVLYTGDKKGSKEVKALLYVIDPIFEDEECDEPLYAIISKTLFAISLHHIKDRPIYPVEWFYASSELENKNAQIAKLREALEGFLEDVDNDWITIETVNKGIKTLEETKI